MDCRISLLLGLGVLASTAGCTPSLFTRSSNSDPLQKTTARKETGESLSATGTGPSKNKEKELPKRKPKAMTCVSFGDFRLRESLTAGRPPAEQRQMRDQAKQAYQQALQIDPKCLEAHRGLSQAYAADDDHERALGALQGALRLAPNDAALWFEVGMMHSRRKEWKPAIDAMAQAVELDQDNRQYANVLGFCLARAGRYEQSLAHFTRVSGEARARYNVGRMMVHNGQIDAGKEQLHLALQREPKLADARDLLTELERPQNSSTDGLERVHYQEPEMP